MSYDEIARPLGNLIVDFNRLEVSVGYCIARVLRQDDFVAAAIVTVLGFSDKLRLLKTLAPKLTEVSQRDTLDGLVSEAWQINANRNRYVHSDYTAVRNDGNTETVQVLAQRLKDFSKPSAPASMEKLFEIFAPVNPEELRELANDASCLANQFTAFADRVS